MPSFYKHQQQLCLNLNDIDYNKISIFCKCENLLVVYCSYNSLQTFPKSKYSTVDINGSQLFSSSFFKQKNPLTQSTFKKKD